MKRKEKEDEKIIQEIDKTRNFVEKPDQFVEELIYRLFKDLEHKKVEHSYVKLTVQDAATIEKETENDKFLDLYRIFDEVNDGATQQKKDNEVIDLMDDINDEVNLFNNTFEADL